MRKFEKFRYLILGMALMLLVSTILSPALAATGSKQLTVSYRDIKIVLDGELITPKDATGAVVEPFVSNGTTYLPVRALCEAIGKPVEWDGATSTVYVGKRPGTVQYMTDIVPAYSVRADDCYKEYSALKSGGVDKFTMAGVTYTNGFTFVVNYPQWAVYNLNGEYTSLTTTLCHVDGSPSSVHPPVLRIFFDGVLKEEHILTSDMAPKRLELNVAGVNQLKIEVDTEPSVSYPVYGFGDPILK